MQWQHFYHLIYYLFVHVWTENISVIIQYVCICLYVLPWVWNGMLQLIFFLGS